MHIVYALIDPRDGLPHYIGATTRGSPRIGHHRLASQQGTKAKKAWVADLAAAGLTYTARELQAGEDWRAIREAEQRWIEQGRAQGWPLTNSTRQNVGRGAGHPGGFGCEAAGCGKRLYRGRLCAGHYHADRATVAP